MIATASVSYWLSGSGPCVWIFPQGERNGHFYPATGTLAGLLLGFHVKETPIGVILDRMEECPEEVDGAAAELVRTAVAWLRERHPNGV